jgi:hypothetical protein
MGVSSTRRSPSLAWLVIAFVILAGPVSAAVDVVLSSPDPAVPYYPGETIHLEVHVTANAGETDTGVRGALAYPPELVTRTSWAQNVLPPSPPGQWAPTFAGFMPCNATPISYCFVFSQGTTIGSPPLAINTTGFPIASAEFTIAPSIVGPQVVGFAWMTTPGSGALDFFGLTNAPGLSVTVVTEPPVPDADADRVIDPDDNCPWVPNAYQQDADTDGVGDACEGYGAGFSPIFFGGQAYDYPVYRWKQCPDCNMTSPGSLPGLPEEGGECRIAPSGPFEVVLSYSSPEESGFACCAYDACYAGSCSDEVIVFKWGTYENAPDTNSDGDIFPDHCDNCPLVENEAQRDYDGDERGNYCDSRPADAFQCGDVDSDDCDDCSPGYFAPDADHVECLPVPEPAATSGMVAGLVALILLVRRRTPGEHRFSGVLS